MIRRRLVMERLVMQRLVMGVLYEAVTRATSWLWEGCGRLGRVGGPSRVQRDAIGQGRRTLVGGELQWLKIRWVPYGQGRGHFELHCG